MTIYMVLTVSKFHKQELPFIFYSCPTSCPSGIPKFKHVPYRYEK